MDMIIKRFSALLVASLMGLLLCGPGVGPEARAQTDSGRRITQKVTRDFDYLLSVFRDDIDIRTLRKSSYLMKHFPQLQSKDDLKGKVFWKEIMFGPPPTIRRVPLLFELRWQRGGDSIVNPDGSRSRATTSDSIFVEYRHIDSLKNTEPNVYNEIVASLKDLDAYARKGAKRDLLLSSRQVDSALSLMPGMRDFWSYAKVHDAYPIDFQMNGDQFQPEYTGESPGADTLHYLFDMSISRLAVSTNQILPFLAWGVEVGTVNDILGLLPLQPPNISTGAWILFNFTQNKNDLLTQEFVKLRVLGKLKANTADVFNAIGKKAILLPIAPLMSYGIPPLNENGVRFDLETSKLWQFPFYLNGSVFFGSKQFDSPYRTVDVPDGKYAYWSSVQWVGMLTFLWNSRSDAKFFDPFAESQLLNQMRFDFGVGTYDVSQVFYDSLSRITRKDKVVSASRIQPYVAFEYTHSSKDQTTFGARLRYFDNKLNLLAWLGLYKRGFDEVRLEAHYISAPLGRSRGEWEPDAGTLLQLRYRFGF